MSAGVAEFEDTLARLGVAGALTAAEARALDDDGFVVLAGVRSRAELERLRAAFEAFVGPEPVVGGRSTGTRHADRLLGEDPAFERALVEPRVLAAARHVLGRPFRPTVFGARDPLPGYGRQGLHTDWTPLAPGDDFAVVTALWALDDFTATSGATRVVPRSHRAPARLPKSMREPAARHPDERIALARAGDVLVFNGHLLHSGTRNDSRGPRRALHVQFVARDRIAPHAEPLEVGGPLGADARVLLGS